MHHIKLWNLNSVQTIHGAIIKTFFFRCVASKDCNQMQQTPDKSKRGKYIVLKTAKMKGLVKMYEID